MNRVLRFVLATLLACSALMLTACLSIRQNQKNSLPNMASMYKSLNSAQLPISKKPWKPANSMA